MPRDGQEAIFRAMMCGPLGRKLLADQGILMDPEDPLSVNSGDLSASGIDASPPKESPNTPNFRKAYSRSVSEFLEKLQTCRSANRGATLGFGEQFRVSSFLYLISIAPASFEITADEAEALRSVAAKASAKNYQTEIVLHPKECKDFEGVLRRWQIVHSSPTAGEFLVKESVLKMLYGGLPFPQGSYPLEGDVENLLLILREARNKGYGVLLDSVHIIHTKWVCRAAVIPPNTKTKDARVFLSISARIESAALVPQPVKLSQTEVRGFMLVLQRSAIYQPESPRRDKMTASDAMMHLWWFYFLDDAGDHHSLDFMRDSAKEYRTFTDNMFTKEKDEKGYASNEEVKDEFNGKSLTEMEHLAQQQYFFEIRTFEKLEQTRFASSTSFTSRVDRK